MEDFDKLLSGAIEKGKAQGKKAEADAAQEKMTQEELKRLHSKYRLHLSEFIEQHMEKIPGHFPGFRYETVYGERGWGAACYRDDAGRGRRDYYSRLEISVKSLGEFNVVDVAVRGTIRNKEVMQRNFFQDIEEVDLKRFEETITAWIVSYAEKFSASN